MPFIGRFLRFGSIDEKAERADVADLVARLRVQAPSIHHPVASLSGGNQQKVIVARWLGAGVDILILDEPTRGIDVNAKAEIHALIGALAEQGKSIILISSELDELLALADNIVVMRQGEVVRQVPGGGASREEILRLAMWGTQSNVGKGSRVATREADAAVAADEAG